MSRQEAGEVADKDLYTEPEESDEAEEDPKE